MLQTSLLLMKSLNKTETPIFLFVVFSLFPKAIFLTYIHTKSLYSNAKIIAFWRNACILHDIGSYKTAV